MATITKTVQTELKAITTLAANLNSVSSVLDVSSKLAATILIDHGMGSTTGPTKGTEYRIEVSEKDSGDDTWRTLTAFVTGIVAAVTYTVDNSDDTGSAVITFTATPTNFAVDDILFFQSGTLANSLWGKIISKSGNGVTLQDNVINTVANIVTYNKGEHIVALVDCTAIKRLRVVCNNNYQTGTASAIVWRCAAITADSIG